MEKNKLRKLTLLGLFIALVVFSFTSCEKKETTVTSTSDEVVEKVVVAEVKTDKDRIIEASKAGKIGNWGLGNEYEILALLAKYNLPLEFLSQDFTMDGFDDDSITLASAMTYNELGLVKNDYDCAYGYCVSLRLFDMTD